MTSDLLKQIKSGYSLPSLAPVAMKLVETAIDDSCSAHDLAKLIETDPSLTVQVLKLANSAFFHTIQPIATLKQAVVKLGLKRLRIMALSLSLRNTFPMGKVASLDYQYFWHTALYRALIAKSLTSYLKGSTAEEAFVAGLIMEIGLLVFFDLRIKQDPDVSVLKLDPLEELLDWEKSRYGLDHRQVGESALRYWRFPENIVECQLLYGNLALSPDAPRLAKVCELSRRLSSLMSRDSSGFHTVLTETGTFLHITQESVSEILFNAFHRVEEIGSSLRMELDRDRDLMEFMGRAHSVLSRISEKMTNYGEKRCPLPSLEILDKSDQLIDTTLQAVAHEIRNPLLVLGGFARRLAASLDPASKGGEYARIILEETCRLEKALSEMISGSKEPDTLPSN